MGRGREGGREGRGKRGEHVPGHCCVLWMLLVAGQRVGEGVLALLPSDPTNPTPLMLCPCNAVHAILVWAGSCVRCLVLS
jgi:hypothetical protein